MVRCFKWHRCFVKFHLIKIHTTQTPHTNLVSQYAVVAHQRYSALAVGGNYHYRSPSANKKCDTSFTIALTSANNAKRKRKQHKQTIKICANRRRHHHYYHQAAC